MQQQELERAAFVFWLRTGPRVIVPDADETERKYNPWHDPEDGQFTFAGSGIYVPRGFGGGGRAPGGGKAPQSSGARGEPKPPKVDARPGDRAKGNPRGDGTWAGGGFTGGGGGRFGGGGAQSNERWLRADENAPGNRLKSLGLPHFRNPQAAQRRAQARAP